MLNVVLRLLEIVPGNEYLQNEYVVSLLILVIAAIVAKFLLFVFSKYLQRIAKKTKTKIDDLIFEKTRKPIFYFVLVYGLKLAVQNLNVNGIFTGIINSLMALVFIFIISRVLDVIISVWGESLAKKTKTNIDDVLLPLFQKGTKIIFIVIAIL